MESSVISYADHPEGALRDGTLSQDGQIMATYVHGLFDAVGAAELIVEWIDPGKTASEGMVDIEEHREKQLQRLADVCEKNLNMDALFQIMNSGMGQ
jgi:adenosylcobyric acid synthase